MIKKLFNLILRALPHISLSIAFVLIVLLITDRFNRAMAFINNDLTKSMMAVFCVLVIIESIAFSAYMTVIAKRRAKELASRRAPSVKGSEMPKMSQHDLYDLTLVLSTLCVDISSADNEKAVGAAIGALKADGAMQDNRIRAAIAEIDGINKERWYFAYHNNVYSSRKMLENNDTALLLLSILEELRSLLEKGYYAKAHALALVVCKLPESIADNGFSVPVSFWKSGLDEYRAKWDKDFLVFEQSNRKRYGR